MSAMMRVLVIGFVIQLFIAPYVCVREDGRVINAIPKSLATVVVEEQRITVTVR